MARKSARRRCRRHPLKQCEKKIQLFPAIRVSCKVSGGRLTQHLSESDGHKRERRQKAARDSGRHQYFDFLE